MKYSVTLNQKRFLIVWICIHSFALFVNLTGLYGTTREGTETLGYANIFTTNGYKNDFWPITTFFYRERYYVPNPSDPRNQHGYSVTFGTWKEKEPSFNGLFTGYDSTEYLFYILLGIGFVFIPKIWNNN